MKFFKSKWFLGLMMLVIGWLATSFIRIKLHENIVNKEVNGLENKIEDFEKSNNALEKLIGYMTHPSFLEKEARLKLNYKSPGEGVAFVYANNDEKTGSVSKDFNRQLARMPNYLKWVYYLIGY